jgi:hypothetical protein
MSIFGVFERLLGEIYPYRWPLAVAALALLAAVAWVGHRRGWFGAIRRRPRTALLAAVVALAVLVPVGGFLLRPLWERTELNEASPLEAAAADEAPVVVAEGTFRGADAFHFGRGTVRVVEAAGGATMLRFDDFSVRNGPDLHVYLSPDPSGYTADALDLGELRATDGSFNHDVPAGTDPSRYASVLIWCEPFSVLFAVAPLAPAPA